MKIEHYPGIGFRRRLRAPRRRKPLIEALEPRLLLSADLPVTLSPDAPAIGLLPEPVVTEVLPGAPNTSAASQSTREIVFVDPALQEVDILLQQLGLSDTGGVRDGVEIIRLNAVQDGVQQITDALAGREAVSGIHILSHAGPGNLRLGSTSLNSANLADYAGSFAAWRAAMTADADILLYGCSVANGEAGTEFIGELARLTGADVAASADETGSAALGGDWVLEASTGVIETSVLSPDASIAWDYLLAPLTFQDDGAGNLTVTGTAGVDDVVLESGPAAGQMTVRTADNSWSQTFSVAGVASLTLDLGNGDDSLALGNFDPAFAGDLRVSNGGGIDSVTVNANAAVLSRGGDITIASDKIDIGAGGLISTRTISGNDYFNAVSTGNSGDITLIAPEITIADRASLLAQIENGSSFMGGDITLFADAGYALNWQSITPVFKDRAATARIDVGAADLRATNINMTSQASTAKFASFILDRAGVDALAATLRANMIDGGDLSFRTNGAGADTIVRATGSWITDGFQPGMYIDISGTVDNDGIYRIASLTDTTLTLASPLLTGNPTLTFRNNPDTATLQVPDTITRSAGSWIDDGFMAGQQIQVSGSSRNDKTFTIASVTDTVITLVPDDVLSFESGNTITVYVDELYPENTVGGTDQVFINSLIGTPLNTQLTFSDNGINPDTITRASGSWISDGFKAGQIITVQGSLANDSAYTIESVTDTTLTLRAGDALTDETGAAMRVTAEEILPGDIPLVAVDSSGNPISAGTFTAGDVSNSLLQSMNNLGLFDLSGYFGQTLLANTSSTITIGSGARLDASNNVALSSTADNDISLSVPGLVVAVTYTESNATSRAVIEGGATVVAGNLFRLLSTVNNTMQAGTKAMSGLVPNPLRPMKIPAPALAVTYGKATTVNEAGVGSNANVIAGQVDVDAITSNDFSVTTKSQVLFPGKNQGSAFGVAISETSSTTDAYLSGRVGATTDVSVDARSVNVNDEVQASAKIRTKLKGQGLAKKAGVNLAKKLNAKADPGTFGATGTFVMAQGSNTATARIGSNAVISAGGDVDVRAYAKETLRSIAAAGSSAGAKYSIGGAVAVSSYNNNANAIVDDGASVNASGRLNIDAQAIVPDVTPFASDLDTLLNMTYNFPAFDSSTPETFFNSVYAYGTEAIQQTLVPVQLLRTYLPNKLIKSQLANSYAVATAKSGNKKKSLEGKVGVSGSVNILDVRNNALARVGEGALVNTNSAYDQAGQNVRINALARSSTLNFSGLKSPFAPFGTKGTDSAAGGAYLGVSLFNDARAYIDDGARVEAVGDIDVRANTSGWILTLGEQGGKAEKVGVSGAFVWHNGGNNAMAWAEETASLDSGGNITFQADNSLVAINVAGVLSTSGKAAVGVGGALNTITNTTRAFIGDFESSSYTVAGTVQATGDLRLAAGIQEHIFAISFAATHAKGQNATPNDDPLDGESLPKLFEEKPVEEISKAGGFSISGSVGVNVVNDTTEAYIADGVTVNVRDLVIDASTRSFMLAINGAVAFNTSSSGAGIAGSFVANDIKRTTRAYTNGVTLSANNVRITANTADMLLSISAGVSGSKLSNTTNITGSGNLNMITALTSAEVGDDTVLTTQGNLVVGASGRTDLLTVAGGVAVTGGPAVGAAADVGVLDIDVLAAIGNNATVNSGGNVDVRATADENIISIGASVAVGTKKLGIAGSVSTYVQNIDVQARIGDGASVRARENLLLHAADDEFGVFIGGSVAGGKTAGFGAAAAVNKINRLVSARIGANATVTAEAASGAAAALLLGSETIQGVRLDARKTDNLYLIAGAGAVSQKTVAGAFSLALNLQNSTVEAAVAAGALVTQTGAGGVRLTASGTNNVLTVAGSLAASGGTAAFGAASASNDIDDNILAYVSGTVNASGDVDIDAQANGAILAIAAGGAGAKTVGVAATATVNLIKNDIKAYLGNGSITSGGDVTLSAADATTISSLAGAVAGGGKVSIGASAAVNDLTVTVGAYVAASNLAASSGQVRIKSRGGSTIRTAAAGGSGAGDVSLAGAATTNFIDNDIGSYVNGNSTITGGNGVNLEVVDASTIESLAGVVTGAGTASIGASVAYNKIGTRGGNLIRAAVENASVTSARGSVDVTASETATIRSLAAGGSGAGTFSGGGAVTINDIGSSILARVTGASVTADAGSKVEATDNSTIQSLAGQINAAGTAAVGAAVATNKIGTNVESLVLNSTVDAGNGGLLIRAASTGTIESLSAGASVSGQVSLTGSVSTNIINGGTRARLDNSTASAGSYLSLGAIDTSTIRSLAGQISVGLGAAGIGGAAAYNEISRSVITAVSGSNAQVGNGDASVVAQSAATIETIAAGGSVGLYVGVAGSVAVNLMANTVSASITGSIMGTPGNLTQLAESANIVRTYGGSLGGGAVGIGGTVTVTTLDNRVQAWIEGSTVSASGLGAATTIRRWNGDTGALAPENIRGMSVIASSTDAVEVITVTAGLGLGGVSANISVVSTRELTEAWIVGSNINSAADYGQAVKVRAHQDTRIDNKGGALSGGALAVASAIDTVVLENTTRAYIADQNAAGSYPTSVASNVYGRDVEVSTQTYESVTQATGGAAVAGVAIGGSVNVVNLANTNAAYIQGSNVWSLGDLSVRADDIARIDSDTGMVAGSLGVSAGASIAVNTISNTTRATLRGAWVNAIGATTISADTDESIVTEVATGAIGLTGGGVGAAITVNAINTTTEAIVESGASRASMINNFAPFRAGGALSPGAGQRVTISADDNASIRNWGGTVAGGTLGGVGATIDVGTIKNRTVARVGQQSSIDAAGSFSLTARSARLMESTVKAYGGATVALNGAISVLSMGSPLDTAGAGQFDAGLQGQVNNNIALNPLPLSGSNSSAQNAASRTGSIAQPSINPALATGSGAGDRVTAAYVEDAGNIINRASIRAGGDLTISASNRYAVNVTGGSGAGGGLSVGVSIANVRIDNAVRAFAGRFSRLTAGGGITIDASDRPNARSTIALTAGSGGLLAGAGADGKLIVNAMAEAGLGDDAVIDGGARVMINAYQDADADVRNAGGTGGLIAGADMRSTIVANTSANAFTGNRSQIGSSAQRVGNISVQATSDNRLVTYSQAVAGGGVAGVGTYAYTTLVPVVDARIGAGSSLWSSGVTTIGAEANDYVDAQVKGDFGGVAAFGVLRTGAYVRGANTQAAIADGALVNSVGDVSVTARTSNRVNAAATGGGGGLISGAGQEAEAIADGVLTRAAVGVNATIRTGGLMRMNAFGSADIDATTSISSGGGITVLEVTSRAQLLNANTEARIGDGANILANAFSALARDIALDVNADASSVNYSAGNSSKATADADLKAAALVFLGQGASIEAPVSISMVARQDSLISRARAKTDTTGVQGALTSTADNEQQATSTVRTMTGSQLTTRDLYVLADSPKYQTNGYIKRAEADAETLTYYVKEIVGYACRTIFGWLGLDKVICDPIEELVEYVTASPVDTYTPGNKVVDNLIDFNSTVTIDGAESPELVVDASGNVIRAVGVTYQNLADRIIVDDIVNTAVGRIFIRSVYDAVIGNAIFNVNNAFDSVTITNNSAKDLIINDIIVINKNQSTPIISIGDETSNFNYTVNTNATGSLVDIRNNNAANAYINLNGRIENDLGITRIYNAGGDITSSGPGVYIDTRDLSLRADRGMVGTARDRIQARLRASALTGLPTLLRDASGWQGVWLDMAAVSRDASALDVRVLNATSGAGQVDIRINDGQREQYATLIQVTLRDGTVVTGSLFQNDVFDPATGVDIVNDIIDLGYAHGLQDGDLVRYDSNGGAPIGGLVSGKSYAVKVIDSTRIQLARVFAPAAVNGNRETINLGGNHGYANGDRVIYRSGGGQAIGGLVDGQAYYVRVIDATTIRLVNNLADTTAVPDMRAFATTAVSGSDIDLGVAHGYVTGQPVTYRASGTPIGGLVDGQTYYAVVVDATTIQLAATRADALAATPTVLALDTSVATGDHGIAALIGVDLDPSAASGAAHSLVRDLTAGATGAAHSLRGSGYYLRDAGGSLIRIDLADIQSTGLVNDVASTPDNGVITLDTLSGRDGVTVTAGSTSTVTTDLLLTGLIESSNGTAALSSVAGDILRNGNAQLIRAQDIRLVAGNGVIGQAGSALRTDVGAGRIDATALGDIHIDEINGDMRVGSIISTTGNVFLSAASGIVDADGDAAADVVGAALNLLARTGRIGTMGKDLDIDSDNLTATAAGGIAITETAGDLNIIRAQTTTGDAAFTAAAGDIRIDRILAAAGSTMLDAAGSLIDSRNDDASNIDSGGFTFTARGGSVGGGSNALDVQVTAAGLALFSATAAQGIHVRAMNGGLDTRRVLSSNGDIRLTIVDQAGAGNDLRLGTGSIVRADNGAVILRVGDNVTIEQGGEVRASGTVTLIGDAGDADAGTGVVIDIRGRIFGASASISGGDDDDRITLTNVTAGTQTTILGGVGSDIITTGIDDAPGSPIADRLILDGGEGSDTYNVRLARSGAARIDVRDTGASGTNDLNIRGTAAADQLLLRRNFVASLHGADVERVNYDANINGTLTIDTLDGDDRIALDDNNAVTVINLGAGNDSAQVGQMFKSPREVPNVAPGDEIDTIQTTRGYLSKGISRATTINGGDGDDAFQVYRNGAALALNGDAGSDSFVVRAFATTNTTAIAGGSGSDYIEYVVNAPVDVDGGAGDDTLVVVGTEFADRFVITDRGVFGAGLSINYTNIESVDIDGMEGDDEFYVQSTRAGSVTRIFGGYGSDTVSVGADVPAGVVAYDAAGNPITFPGIAQTVDNIAGPLYVFGGLDPNADRSLVDAVILPTETDTGAFPTIVPPDPSRDRDTLNVFDQDSTADDTGTLSGTRLTGLGMGGDQIIGGKTYNGGITYQDFESMNVLLGSGNDRLTVTATHAGTTTIDLGAGNDNADIRGVDGDTVIRGNDGDDRFIVSDRAPLTTGGLTTSINRNLALYGEAGNDRMIVDDSGETRDTRLDLTASTLDIEYMAGTISYGTMEDILIRSGAGNDIFNVSGTDGGARTRIMTLGGNDIVNVAGNAPALTGTLDALAGDLDIDAGSGDNTLNVSDAGSNAGDGTAVNPVRIDRASITGLAPGRIGYTASGGSYAGGVNIRSGQGADTVRIGSTRAGDVTSVWFNDGDDAIIVADDGSGADGLLVLFGESGNDSIDASAWNDGLVAFGDFGQIDYSGRIAVYQGGSVERKSNAGITRLATARGGEGGDDRVTTGAGDDRVFGGYGADTLSTGAGEDRIVGDNGEFRYLNGRPEHLHATDTDAGTGGGDTIDAGDGRDLVIGGVGSDVINGQGGNDYILGDNGEFFFLQSGQSVVLKNSGDVWTGDTDPFSMDVMWSTDPALGGDDTIDGGDGEDYIIGGAANDLLLGRAGEDMLSGDGGQMVFIHWQPVIFETIDPFLGGNDELNGGNGRDVMLGGFGGDLFHGDLGEDVMVGEYARVTLDGDKGLFVVRLGQGNLDLIGSTQFGLYLPQSLQSRFSLGGIPRLPDVSGRQLPVTQFNQVRASQGASHPGEPSDPSINIPAPAAGQPQKGDTGTPEGGCAAPEAGKQSDEQNGKAQNRPDAQDGKAKKPLCKPKQTPSQDKDDEQDDKRSQTLGAAIAGLAGWRVTSSRRSRAEGRRPVVRGLRRERIMRWEAFAGKRLSCYHDSGEAHKQFTFIKRKP